VWHYQTSISTTASGIKGPPQRTDASSDGDEPVRDRPRGEEPIMAKKVIRFGSTLSTLAAVLLSAGAWWKY
jgi:hypothetical protein